MGGQSLDPNVLQRIQGSLGQVSDLTSQLREQAPNLANQVQTNFSQFTPQLQTNFTQPQFGPGLDRQSQAAVSRAQQDIASSAGAQQAQIQRRFQNQPGVASILGAQLASRQRLQQNPLQFQALQQQTGRQIQQAQAQNQAQALANQARLAQGQEQARLAQLSNAALAQQLGIQTSPLQAQQQLLATLGTLAQLPGFTLPGAAGGGEGLLPDNLQAGAAVGGAGTLPFGGLPGLLGGLF